MSEVITNATIVGDEGGEYARLIKTDSGELYYLKVFELDCDKLDDDKYEILVFDACLPFNANGKYQVDDIVCIELRYATFEAMLAAHLDLCEHLEDYIYEE